MSFFKAKSLANRAAVARNEIEKREEGNARLAQFRSFAGALTTRVNQFLTSFITINEDLKKDYHELALRARDLAKNDSYVIGFINAMIRNVIGGKGFRLKVTTTGEAGAADSVFNAEIEKAYRKYAASGVNSAENLNARELDILILKTLIIDGEVFIEKIKTAAGIKYKLLDTLAVNIFENRDLPNGNAIKLGVELDSVTEKPIRYFLRDVSKTYHTRSSVRTIEAADMIHIFRPIFAGQVRGFTPLASVLLNMNQLGSYIEAEIIAARLGATFMGIWKQSASSATGGMTSNAARENVASTLANASFKFAPDGYELQTIQSNHPNVNLEQFNKAILRGVSSCLGLSYNKFCGDYESVNYSSLRQANCEDERAWRELQQFLVDAWKVPQYFDFLSGQLPGSLAATPGKLAQLTEKFKFFGCAWSYLDPTKESMAVQLDLGMMITDPIFVIEQRGRDVDEVLDAWQLWQEKLAARNLQQTSAAATIRDVLEYEKQIENENKTEVKNDDKSNFNQDAN